MRQINSPINTNPSKARKPAKHRHIRNTLHCMKNSRERMKMNNGDYYLTRIEL